MMKWLPFIILAAAFLVCQTTIAPLMAIRSIWPNWMFILAVHYSLWGPWPDAAIGAWILGLCVDLQTLRQPGGLGLYAFMFGAAAYAIIHMRQVFFREHPLTQLLITLVFSMIVELVVEGYRAWGLVESVSRGGIFWSSLFTALYTAALAPYLHWPLDYLGRWTGLRTAGQSRDRK